ncbi:2-nitropropane dioxygenase-like enzyme [Neocallimastix californiae]|uniref:2-nitropropane dioxygenase-like enzyme n=1 Tax=Neocallimastix californiae TaxID=1754190 RepID=A0A1Y2EP80_9FUNG|nr:2-nitropropane dioxygenase-like enzyme [Neocallimastix californiae]|eukprot:ORY73352.1 2-nitropropane dioxygenase-like enzyme [Neocallimastix californiae]
MGKNRVCEILGIEKPVIQAPMAWITSPELVAAVSNAGGLGVFGTSGGFEEEIKTVEGTIEEMRKCIRKARQLTDKPFGMNVFPSTDDPYGFSKATIQLCKEENIKILIFVGNVVPEEISQLKKDGFIIVFRESNPTVNGALAAEKAGADIIVATGCDEGGCAPILINGTMSIVALISEYVKIPVVAAGGIINSKFAKASAILGAEGAFVGTRFILSKECRAAQATKDDIMTTKPDDFIVYEIFGGHSRIRTTPHRIGKEGLAENSKGNNNPRLGSFYHGMLRGNVDEGVITVANVTPLIKSIDSCETIVNEIAEGYEY